MGGRGYSCESAELNRDRLLAGVSVAACIRGQPGSCGEKRVVGAIGDSVDYLDGDSTAGV